MCSPPKVFISHASEDKERFVTEFARKLRERGIDAWMDKWEMLPGDSLVDKIFEEGLKNAQAVIVVLSKSSVSKRWVREELNAAMVKRINDSSKLIPIIIDDCEVPECLKSTVWERITDLDNYDEELKHIVMSIFGQTDKPPIGQSPKYVQQPIVPIGTLTNLDGLIFQECCRLVLTRDHEYISGEELSRIAKSHEIPESEMEDSVEVLDGRGYVKVHPVIGCRVHRIEVTHLGFDEFLEATRPDFPEIVKAVAFKIVNESVHNGAALNVQIHEPIPVLNHVIRLLERRGMITISRYMGGPCSFQVMRVSPELKRWLRNE